MTRKQQIEQDRYLESLLGNNHQPGYHSQAVDCNPVSTLGRQILTTVLPESSRKAEAK